MPRLTRPESQAQTRADLIATARDLFLTNGYSKTTLDEVADAAGYSKGAVYSNFKNKKVLCLEVLDLIHTTKFGEISELLVKDQPLDKRLDDFQAWAEKTLGDPGWTMLEFEFAVVARDDAELHAQLIAVLALVRGMVVTILETTTASMNLVLPIPVEDAASSLLSLGIGLGIQRAIDPSISARLITDGLRMLLSYAALHGENQQMDKAR
ncbi:TetR/AcrR family transcriptional regulator [Antrihabitans stalactiti]|uniref:TetR/AcrR family transcriptional regulator n=1 Tax=Antrihabitans stalactiti TaxID=2584121 RepID=A0A848KAK8_9NOCA|nr:TetR/AcrR family transcriptional regulator [Antrihabitans stalactiti]NMN95391.1 TetR/AcrR family transcriptional regulator [Antrihabitans stalactiti]